MRMQIHSKNGYFYIEDIHPMDHNVNSEFFSVKRDYCLTNSTIAQFNKENNKSSLESIKNIDYCDTVCIGESGYLFILYNCTIHLDTYKHIFASQQIIELIHEYMTLWRKIEYIL